jgi:hypothetical protein
VIRPGDYIVKLRPLPHAAPAIIRLRRALKLLGRAHGLRCLAVDEVHETGERPVAVEEPVGVETAANTSEQVMP